jgi:probable HAF family extracellular repeat protein
MNQLIKVTKQPKARRLRANSLATLALFSIAGLMGLSPSATAAVTYTLTDLGKGLASDINSSGQVAGTDYYSSPVGAILWTGTTPAILGSLLGGAFSGVSGLNDTGQVIGTSSLTGGEMRHATIWNGTAVTDLGTLGGSSSSAIGINNSGQVVGWSHTSGDLSVHATVWSGATLTDLGTLAGGMYSEARDINSSGEIVGVSSSGVRNLATVWSRGSVSSLGTLGGLHSYANSVNDSGLVVGASDISGPSGSMLHASKWDGNGAVDLGTLGGTQSWAQDVNSSGQVVGWSYIADSSLQHATLWEGEIAIDLNIFLTAEAVSTGWYLAFATGINDNGQIAGTAINSITGQYDAYRLTVSSVPEPKIYALILAGLGALAFLMRRAQA